MTFPWSKPKQEPRKITKDEVTNIWLEGFRVGFDKAFSIMPEMQADLRKKIESQAIEETLKRLNRGDLLPPSK